MAKSNYPFRFISPEDLSDPHLARKLEPLFLALNSNAQVLGDALANQITLTDNISCEVVSAKCTHNVPQIIKLKKLRSARMIIGASCSRQTNGPAHAITRVALRQTGRTGEIELTTFFYDATATRINCP